jgi:hypothetical protein
MDDIIMNSFFDEIEKIGAAVPMSPIKKTLGLMGTGAALGIGGVHFGGKALDRYRIGKAVQEQMQQRQQQG